jgi:hypothetical protein
VKELASSKESTTKKEVGFQSLFNGTDYKTDWEAGPGTAPNAWKVENGALVSIGSDPLKPFPSTLLLSRQEFSDFDLHFEFKTSTGGLSGVVPKAIVGQDKQIGIPVMHDSFPMFRTMPIDDPQTLYTGALRFVGIDKKAFLKPVEQWNSMEVRVRWPHIRIKVNDQETVVASLDSEKIQRILGKPLPKTSKIGLYNNLGIVSYRKIEVQKLSP